MPVISRTFLKRLRKVAKYDSIIRTHDLNITAKHTSLLEECRLLGCDDVWLL
jgi:hypothetical protein